MSLLNGMLVNRPSPTLHRALQGVAITRLACRFRRVISCGMNNPSLSNVVVEWYASKSSESTITFSDTFLFTVLKAPLISTPGLVSCLIVSYQTEPNFRLQRVSNAVAKDESHAKNCIAWWLRYYILDFVARPAEIRVNCTRRIGVLYNHSTPMHNTMVINRPFSYSVFLCFSNMCVEKKAVMVTDGYNVEMYLFQVQMNRFFP
jgi:hypothetical protein